MHIKKVQDLIDVIRGKKRNIEEITSKQICGENNIVKVTDEVKFQFQVVINGNNNKVIINTKSPFGGGVQIGTPDSPVDNCEFIVGENTTSNGISTLIMEDGCVVRIGEDCMFSDNIIMYSSDTHSILDENKKLINIGKSIEIGNHVWICQYVKFTKNTKIPDNCVVGMGSIVTKKFDKPNCVIAGNPAKIVKENINWDRRRPKQYLKENINANS